MIAIFIVLILSAHSQVNFVAVGDDSTGATFNSIAHSQDGTTWTPVVDRIFGVAGIGVTYSDRQQKWMAVGQGSNTIAWSPNGTGWIGLGAIALTTVGNSIKYSETQNMWVAVGQGTSTVVYSQDGFNWTAVTPNVFDISGNGVEFSSSQNRWVAVGWSATKIAWSPNGVTWNSLGNIVFSNRGLAVTFGNGIWVATGMTSQTQAWSPDGVTWTPTSEFISNTRQDVAFGQGKWLLVGPNPTTFQDSLNGTSWTNRGSAAGMLDVFGITYSSILAKWVAVGSPFKAATSPDGFTWTIHSTPFSTQAWKVAAFHAVTSNLTADVINLITGTAVIPTGVAIGVVGNLTVNGNLTVQGTWSIGVQAAINVSGVLSISGSTEFNTSTFSGQLAGQLSVVSLEITVGAQLTVTIASIPSLGTSSTFRMASFNERSGTFALSSVRSAVQSAPGECLSGSQVYTSSTLDITVSNSACSGNVVSSGPVGGSSTPAQPDSRMGTIIGVSVACAVSAILITLAIVMITKKKRDEYDRKSNAALRKDAISDLKPNPGVNL